MGFHRLGIVDPTGDGMQPFETSRFVCIINGEIYNYRSLIRENPYELRSNSDCEIVVHLFENIVGSTKATTEHMKTLVRMLNGEFAIIIYELDTNNVFYAVDQVRARPLYIGTAQSKQQLWIASEHKAILGADRIIEVTAGECGFVTDGIEISREHHFLYDNLLNGRVPQIENAKYSFHQAAERVYDMFVKNLELKSNPERQAGYLLSGGLDSSLVCGASSKILYPHRIRTFTGGFHVDASDIQAARKVAKHINSIHTE